MEELKQVAMILLIIYRKNCKSFIVTSGGELTKFIDKKSKIN